MSINLHELIINPGKKLPFRHELSTERLDFPAVSAYTSPVVGEGVIRNEAGLLVLEGSISADMLCICDRCAAEFPVRKVTELDLTLATELEDEENPDFYLLENEELDMDDVLEGCFIMDMDMRFLCREDCRGLCSRCGANLNDGDCGCQPEKDPRLAVLEQLLDDKE